MVIRKWKLKRDKPRPAAVRASSPSRIVFPPISTAMPGPVNGNYLYHRVFHENSVWILAACSRLLHTASLDNSALGREHHSHVEFLFEFALFLSNATYSRPQDQPSLLPVAGEDEQSQTQRFVNNWGIAVRNRDVVYQSLIMVCALLLAHGDMLRGQLDDFQFMVLLISKLSKSNAQHFRNLDQTIQECLAKLDLLYVLRFRAPPLLGSVFAQTMQPLRPEMVQDVTTARAGTPGASTSAP